MLLLITNFCLAPAAKKQLIKPQSVAHISQEETIISEIKSLLKNGTVPSKPFNDWCDSYIPTLIVSKNAQVKDLGTTLQAIRNRQTEKISAFKVLPTFEKAVQVYDQNFHIRTLVKPVIIAKGTYWYFSRSKK